MNGEGGGVGAIWRWSIGIAVLAVLGGVLPGALEAPAGAASTGQPITWLAAGDSYSSGQGLAHPSGPCARGTGQDGSGSTWAVVAAGLLKSQGMSFASGDPDLVACTGAISDQFFHADGSADEPQWRPAMKRYDLVTFNFGGDDIQFKSTITQCTLALHFCAPANTERNKITELGSSGDYVLGIHEPGYPSFLNHVATTAVVKGGNVVVMGYPDVFEDPTKWGNLRATCSGFQPFIVDRMRGWAGDLNATIGQAVANANAEPAAERNGVHFTFVNPVNGGGLISSSDPHLFEPSTGLHHELCSPGYQTWVNGFSLPKSHSYHPNQAGENAMGHLAAEAIAKLTWPWTASAPTPAPASPGESSATLGVPLGNLAGFGQVAPNYIWLGGDYTSAVASVTWSNWGAPEATGTGIGHYDPPNGGMAVQAPADVVAFNLGTCGSGPAYTAYEWYFPSQGQTFDLNDYTDTCTGLQYPPLAPVPTTVSTQNSGNTGAVGDSGNSGSSGNSGNS
jgi:hypothetical protein